MGAPILRPVREIGYTCGLAVAALLVALGPLASPAAAADRPLRPGEPVTLTGADLGALLGAAPESVVAFAHERRDRGGRRGRGGWRQVPVQIDERLVSDFGTGPNQGRPRPGVGGTVYGTEPSGLTALQYADPGTFVGPDPDRRFDADDELTFMAADAGGRLKRPGRKRPRGVRGARPVEIRISDPISARRRGSRRRGRSLYLFRSSGKRRPSAGLDYVAYDFNLLSGDYRTTYQRADGPNPEASSVTTGRYTVGYSDRWSFDRLHIHSGSRVGPDILDGFKFGFGPGVCNRSEDTFNDAEGAFAANIDGPVRAIRSYVGANSGPRTQRTDFFYEDRHLIVTDLRVHAVPGPLIYHDLSQAGVGMTFRSSSSAAPVAVDGVPDDVSSEAAEWQLWSGTQGSLFAADRLESSVRERVLANAGLFYLDDSTPPYRQCWGDQQALAQAGFISTTPLPNTDPGRGPAETFRGTTTDILAAGPVGPRRAERWSEQIDTPLRARVRAPRARKP